MKGEALRITMIIKGWRNGADFSTSVNEEMERG